MKRFLFSELSFPHRTRAEEELSGEDISLTNASLNWMGERPRNLSSDGQTPGVARETTAPICCVTLVVALALTGCANTGAPKPPSLRLPKPATHLVATRTGDAVTLRWDTPAETTDGATYRGAMTAQVCRVASGAVPPAGAAACQPVLRRKVLPGASEATEILPQNLLMGKPALLTYQVELFNDHDHSAGPSAPVFAASGPAPPAVGTLAHALRRNGVLVTWQPIADSGSVVELHRTLAQVSGKPAKSAPAKGPLGTSEQSAADVTLRPGSAPVNPTNADPGGIVDRTLHDGDTATYTGQRVRTVQLLVPTTPPIAGKKKPAKPRDPKPSLQPFELRGVPSPPLTIAFRDTIPPAPPTGLASIGSAPGATPSIDLSWDPAPELDVTGYNIYRAEAAAVEASSKDFLKLNATAANGPGYRDLTALPGHAYLYRVTAVDARGNESAPTAPLRSDELR